MEVKEQSLREVIGIAIGEASMCWSEMPSGVFDSTKAGLLVDRILNAIDRKTELQSLINGHIEAMRPLLDEWSKLK